MIPNWVRAFAPAAEEADIHYLLCELLDCSPAELAFQDIESLPQNLRQTLCSWLKRLDAGEPPQYITGRAWFYGLPFTVNPCVLIPRFDSEVLIEALLPYAIGNKKVLDIGTGSGILAITLKKLCPQLQMHATDVCEDALHIAQINSSLHQTEISFYKADIFPKPEKDFDIIVSNPPYISGDEYARLDQKVRRYEPKKALYADDNGFCFFKRILDRASQYLKQNGILAFEHGFDQQHELLCLTEKAGYETLMKGKDIADRDRFLILRLC